jgi:hypothetical protein
LAKKLDPAECAPLRKGGKKLRKLAWAVDVGAGHITRQRRAERDARALYPPM